jgi:hypothetical protein
VDSALTVLPRTVTALNPVPQPATTPAPLPSPSHTPLRLKSKDEKLLRKLRLREKYQQGELPVQRWKLQLQQQQQQGKVIVESTGMFSPLWQATHSFAFPLGTPAPHAFASPQDPTDSIPFSVGSLHLASSTVQDLHTPNMAEVRKQQKQEYQQAKRKKKRLEMKKGKEVEENNPYLHLLQNISTSKRRRPLLFFVFFVFFLFSIFLSFFLSFSFFVCVLYIFADLVC